MSAGEVLLAGKARRRWAGGELVPDETIHPFGDGHVEGGLEIGR